MPFQDDAGFPGADRLIWNGVSRRWFCLVDGMASSQVRASALTGQSLAIPKDGYWLGLSCVPRVWWWSGGSWGGTTRRVSMDRLAATLIFAGWDRTSAKRRKVPLTTVARHKPRHSLFGDRFLQRRRPGASHGCAHLLGRSRG